MVKSTATGQILLNPVWAGQNGPPEGFLLNISKTV